MEGSAWLKRGFSLHMVGEIQKAVTIVLIGFAV